MKRFLILSAVILISALTFSSAFAARDPFLGAWESTDLDGSYQTLVIAKGGPGNTYFVRYYDFGPTSICGVDPTNGKFYAASAQGLLTRSEGKLIGQFPVYCMTHPPTFWGDSYISYQYDPETDTLIDPAPVVWTRR